MDGQLTPERRARFAAIKDRQIALLRRGMTLKQDMIDLPEWLSMVDEPNASLDDLIAAIEKHLDQMEMAMSSETN